MNTCTTILLLLLSCGAYGGLSSAFAFSLPRSSASDTGSVPTFSTPFKGQTNIVSISIIIDEANCFDELANWLRALNFRNFTFVVVEGTTNAYMLENATRLGILRQYGEIIPRLPLMQGYAPDNRVSNANFTLNEFTQALGYTPRGVMDFVPDTFTAHYLLSRGVEYYQGYCFDQFDVDRMTMRGGFQMPYYANSSNILCPNPGKGGMVVLPHSTWDWVASFKISHNLQLHPTNLLNMRFEGNQTAKNYFLNLIDNTFAGSCPFGYVTVQFEWSWLLQDGDALQVLDWLQELISTRPFYNYLTFENTVNWFKANYDQTPTYRVNFTSPYDGTQIEWFYGLSNRVARIGNDVRSYVDYVDQQPDRYLTNYSPIYWGSPTSSTNSIDNSLSFKVDALGGGYLRASASSESVSYDGDLASFGAFYAGAMPAKAQNHQLLAVISVSLVASAAVAGFFFTTRGKRLLCKERT